MFLAGGPQSRRATECHPHLCADHLIISTFTNYMYSITGTPGAVIIYGDMITASIQKRAYSLRSTPTFVFYRYFPTSSSRIPR